MYECQKSLFNVRQNVRLCLICIVIISICIICIVICPICKSFHTCIIIYRLKKAIHIDLFFNIVNEYNSLKILPSHMYTCTATYALACIHDTLSGKALVNTLI